jgi:hypothetical protein
MEAAEMKVKEKREGQRVCDEKDAKGKPCLGHLKRWYRMPAEISKQLGPDAQVFRCDKCHTLYRPTGRDRSSAGQKFEERTVNLLGNPVPPRQK